MAGKDPTKKLIDDLATQTATIKKENDSTKRDKFKEINLSFTKEIMDIVKPKELKMPSFTSYDRSRNPVEHVDIYQEWIVIHGTHEPLLCKGFPSHS
ncbi:hypothetical protein TorRG33x02_331710 [Trema orientale]|uniref:Uncharacterized protein n=1 Tax=Trema orientale TaxID=63057 RepID=A0A2P5B5R7_TREOI|nr:hypothetical protein TorRG33x02_331710 [Trema orientale]